MLTHRMAVVTATATFFLLLAGGLVHSTGSGLACPDWPLCYGMFFPPMVGNIRFEHSHRLIAASVGLLTAVTAALVLKRERPTLKPLALLAIAAIVLQILLGGLTVIYRLPDLVSTAHLAVGTAFFSLLVVLCVRTATAPVVQTEWRTRTLILTATAMVYIQMVLGALVRHTESGLACPDIPYCQGEWMKPIATPAGLHLVHRFGSFAVLAAVAAVYLTCRRLPALRPWSTVALGLTVIQIFLGAMSVLTKLTLWAVMAHLGAAISMLTCLVVMSAKTCATAQDRPMAVMAEA